MTISPCVKICSLSEGVCQGCGRTVDEISLWTSFSDEEKNLWHTNHPKFVAGIGSRDTPPSECTRIEHFSAGLQRMRYTLRSGAAYRGADKAFEKGAIYKEIIVPEKAKQDQISFLSLPLSIQKDAMDLAQKYHPRWDAVKDLYSQRLLARNVVQILGKDLKTPVDFVMFWADRVTLNSSGIITNCSGGTGLGVRLASSLGIPCVHTSMPQFQDIYDSIGNADLSGLQKSLENIRQISRPRKTCAP